MCTVRVAATLAFCGAASTTPRVHCPLLLAPFCARGESDRSHRTGSSFPSHFNESELFRGGKQARKLKVEFRDHFRNISRIMDCVGCEKCKLWGTLQVGGTRLAYPECG